MESYSEMCKSNYLVERFAICMWSLHIFTYFVFISYLYIHLHIYVYLSLRLHICVCTQHQEDQCGVLGCQKQLQAMNSVCLCLVLMPVGKASGCLAPPLG